MKRGCWWRLPLLAVGGLLLAAYCCLPALMAIYAVAPFTADPGTPPAGYQSVTLQTADAVTLGAWYAAPQNGMAIIVVHGSGNGRQTVVDYAEMLREAGFGVLAFNLRGYGDSEGQLNRLGWYGTRDVGAAVQFLQQQPGVNAIGGLGISLGGEVLLGAAAEYPAMQAIVADGATYRSVEEYTALASNDSLWRSFTLRVYQMMVKLFSGDDPPQRTLLESIQLAEGTQFLWIVAGNEAAEQDYNTLFAENAEPRGTLWIVDGITHTQAYEHDPIAYQERVVGFFQDALGSANP